MNGNELLGILVPAVALLVAASLEVASRAAARLDVHRWAQRTLGADADEGAVWTQIDETFTTIRLSRQISLVFLVVAVSSIGPKWLGIADGGPGNFAAAAALSMAAYLLIDKLLAFTVVALLGPIRVLDFGRPVISVLRLLFSRLARMLNRFQRDSRARDEPVMPAPEDGDLDAFLDMAEESGLVSEHDEALLRGVAEFTEVHVDHVMTPRVDIASIAESSTLGELSDLVAEQKHSRIPVVKENIDQVVGVANIRELVAALQQEGFEGPVSNIARPALFVPETKRVSDLLREFQKRREHLAIVVDEYGGTAGLVTLEDLLEEIVGEIQDEHEDDEEQTVVQLEDGAVVAAGKAEIEDIEQLLDVTIGDDEFETVGGMAFAHLGYVPKPGESFERNGLYVEVLEADERRVHRVRISAAEATAE